MESWEVAQDAACRLMAKVRIEGDCWLFCATRNHRGYGRFGYLGKVESAHIVSYLLAVGPYDRTRLEIDHLCRVRCCVNPEHLEPVTRRVNQLRGFSVAGIYARRTHCKHGHEYTPENTFFRPHKPNARLCRICDKRRALERRLVRS